MKSGEPRPAVDNGLPRFLVVGAGERIWKVADLLRSRECFSSG